MKKIIVLPLVFALFIETSAQDYNKIGAAGISFLLNSNSGQKNLNHDEKVALSILGAFLNEKSNRQHEMNVANASSSKIVYTTSGEQIQLVRDAQGNVYLLQNGIIHPVSNQVISMATVSEYADTKTEIDNYSSTDRNSLRRAFSYTDNHNKKFSFIKYSFLYREYKDINNNSYADFDDFLGLSRIVKNNDIKLHIAVGYWNSTKTGPLKLKLTIYKDGDEVYYDIHDCDYGDRVSMFHIRTFPLGTGIFEYEIIGIGECFGSSPSRVAGKFQIVD